MSFPADSIPSSDRQAPGQPVAPNVTPADVTPADGDLAGWFSVWLILLAASFSGTMIPGVNEPHYLCKARAFADSAWCDRDFFLTSSNAHYCFYVMLQPLILHLPFWGVAVVGRCVSLAIVAWGWLRLSRLSGLSNSQMLLAAAIMIVLSRLGNFSGEWIIGGFESKVPAWGLILVATAYWISFQQTQKRADGLLAGILTGLATALHPVVGMWAVISFGMTQLAACFVSAGDAEKGTVFGRLQQMAASAAWLLIPFAVTASAGIIPAVDLLFAENLSAADKSLSEFIQVFWRLRHHMDPTQFRLSQWVHTGLLVTGILAVKYWRTRQATRRTNLAGTENMLADKPDTADKPARTVSVDCANAWLWGMLTSTALIAATGVVIGWHTGEARLMTGWQWRAALLKFYPFRLFDGLLPIVLSLSFTGCLRQRFTRLSFIIQTAIWISLVIGVSYRPAVPSGYSRQQFQDWQTACRWLQHNTPPSSLVMTPRESYGFKWFAERAEYVVYKDCPQDAAGILEWNRRLWYLNGWTAESSADGIYDTADLRRLRTETSCDYVLTRSLGPFQAKPVHSAGEWRIYEVP